MKRLTKVMLSILALMLVAGTVQAAPSEKAAPYLRAHDWQAGLLKFLANHPELTNEKIQAIQDSAQIGDPGFFAQAVDKDKRDLLAERMKELGLSLSLFEYRELLSGFSRNLVSWMVATEVIGEDGGATPNCNCGDSQDCAGGSCRNVTCVHEGGTSHSGRC